MIASCARGGVLLLDDPGDRPVLVPEDAAVRAGLGEVGGDDGDRARRAIVVLDELPEGVASEEGNVPVRDENGAGEVGREGVEGALRRATRALDLVLVRDERAGVDLGDVGGDPLPFVPDDDGEVLGGDLAGGGHGVPEEAPAADVVEDLGGRRPHPGALAGGEDDHGSRGGCSHARALQESAVGFGTPVMLPLGRSAARPNPSPVPSPRAATDAHRHLPDGSLAAHTGRVAAT